jgi:hypothetical protein
MGASIATQECVFVTHYSGVCVVYVRVVKRFLLLQLRSVWWCVCVCVCLLVIAPHHHNNKFWDAYNSFSKTNQIRQVFHNNKNLLIQNDEISVF